jgi:uncharacterized membrane protein YqjE
MQYQHFDDVNRTVNVSTCSSWQCVPLIGGMWHVVHDVSASLLHVTKHNLAYFH